LIRSQSNGTGNHPGGAKRTIMQKKRKKRKMGGLWSAGQRTARSQQLRPERTSRVSTHFSENKVGEKVAPRRRWGKDGGQEAGGFKCLRGYLEAASKESQRGHDRGENTQRRFSVLWDRRRGKIKLKKERQ